jgi:hypothetical protein
VRLVSAKKFSDSQVLAVLGRTPSRSGEFLVIAAGGLAMLLVVGLFDMCGLLP